MNKNKLFVAALAGVGIMTSSCGSRLDVVVVSLDNLAEGCRMTRNGHALKVGEASGDSLLMKKFVSFEAGKDGTYDGFRTGTNGTVVVYVNKVGRQEGMTDTLTIGSGDTFYRPDRTTTLPYGDDADVCLLVRTSLRQR